ncbi:hypothetical protein N0V82_007937 [Gnomoniopsis sp. IMI 355080]|nr:hypothetical protein N0V82_007937 [Gnomoniopsis sp. IMI 355080]
MLSRPTTSPLEEVQAAFDQLSKPLQNGTELMNFLSAHFSPAGAELVPLTGANLTTNATFLTSMNNPINEEFVQVVMSKWENLTRVWNETSVCAECQSSFIPIKRPFVVAGGRFREAYYWDSYWILQGLLRTGGSFTQISRNQIENFLDNVENFGFVPNGGRKYYLNRSQPPMLTQMVKIYMEYAGDTSILTRALPLLMAEHDFFVQNRSVSFDLADTNKTYILNQYNVENNQPRPESYREDWEQVNNASYYAASGDIYVAPNLTATEAFSLYRNLASGAESGWDFSSRFLRNPRDAIDDISFPLRSLNVVNMVPVDLNSFLYWNEIAIAEFLVRDGQADNATLWEERAQQRAEAMHAVMWNETLNTYLDYNLTSNSQQAFTARDADALPIETMSAPTNDTQVVFNVAQLLPFLTGAALPEVKANSTLVKKAFERVSQFLDARAGGIAPTNFRTTQQWDQPSVWPPHMQMLMDALLQTPSDDDAWAWAHDLALRLGQRYLDSAYCTWRATGGETDSSPKLGGLNASTDLGGLMFEKYSDESLNQAGGGGEYEVVVGFGWSNGVLIWVADTFRDKLQTPPCTSDLVIPNPPTGVQRRSAVELASWDAQWISRSVGGQAGIR